MFIDTHAHLDFGRFNRDRKEVIARARENGVEYIVNAGADLSSSHRALELSTLFPQIYAAAGIHPHDADQLDEEALKVIADIAKADKVVAIGETGLDFHYDNSPRPQQKKSFRLQIQLAQELGLPVIVHSREADEDTLEILREEEINKTGGILHCFSSDREMAEAVLELGMYIAFGGIITFKSAGSLREVVRTVPEERLLIETDAPYLTPEPHRGKRNEPAYVRYVAEEIAHLKGISIEKIGEITSTNAREIYHL